MRLLKGVLLVLMSVVLAASTAVFALSCSAVSSAGPSLAMALVDKAGGAEKVVSGVLETLIPEMPGDEELRDEIIKAAVAAIPPKAVRELSAQAISGFRRFMDSGGTNVSILVDLRDIKSAFMNELAKNYGGSLDEIETALEDLPDKADLAGILPIGNLEAVTRPYRIVTNLPLVSAAVAGACLAVLALIAGPVPGLRIAGWCLLIGGLAVLALTFAGEDQIQTRLARLIPDLNSEIPLPIDPIALVYGVSDFLFLRLRLVSGLCAATGAAAALFVPLIAKRRAARGQPTA